MPRAIRTAVYGRAATAEGRVANDEADEEEVMASDEPGPLSIGAVLGDGDRKSMQWHKSIAAIMTEVRSRRAGVSSPLNVNVVYHVDGRMAPNEFAGVRTGRFSRKSSALIVQAAVTDTSLEPEEQRPMLMELLNLAIDEAEEFARKKKIASSLDEIRGILDQLV